MIEHMRKEGPCVRSWRNLVGLRSWRRFPPPWQGQILEVAHQSGLNHGAVGSEMVVIQENTDEPFLLLEIGVVPHVVQGGPERLKAVVGNPIHYRFMAPETLQGRGSPTFPMCFPGNPPLLDADWRVPLPRDSPEEIMANQSQKPPRTPGIANGSSLPLSNWSCG